MMPREYDITIIFVQFAARGSVGPEKAGPVWNLNELRTPRNAIDL